MNNRISLVRKEMGYKQDDFAEKLGLTKNFISLIETGKREPSDRTIKDICREFNVNEEWLRTGKGAMFIELSQKDELILWASKVLSGRSDDFRNKFVNMLCKLDEDQWEILANMAETMVRQNDKKKD